MSQYDKEMVELFNERKTVPEIAQILCVKHSLDPKLMNLQAVESRIWHLQTNKMYEFAPVNSSMNMHAVDIPQGCMHIYFIFIILILS